MTHLNDTENAPSSGNSFLEAARFSQAILGLHFEGSAISPRVRADRLGASAPPIAHSAPLTVQHLELFAATAAVPKMFAPLEVS